jgi:hypothetical protein
MLFNLCRLNLATFDEIEQCRILVLDEDLKEISIHIEQQTRNLIEDRQQLALLPGIDLKVEQIYIMERHRDELLAMKRQTHKLTSSMMNVLYNGIVPPWARPNSNIKSSKTIY